MVAAVGNIQGKRLLDVGCGAGIHAKYYVQQRGIVSGIDISKTMIQLARKNCPKAEFKIGEIANIPYPNDYFDVITASLMVNYASNLKEAFLEVNRVLKKGMFFYYSNEGVIASASESKRNSRFEFRFAGYIKDKLKNKIMVLGNTSEEIIKKIEIVPKMEVISYRRSLKEHVKAIVGGGFELIDILDCNPLPELKKYDPQFYNICSKIPYCNIYVCRKK